MTALADLDLSNAPENLTVKNEVPGDFWPKFSEVQNRSGYASKQRDKTLVNPVSGASVSVKDDGQLDLAASLYAQVKVSPNGQIIAKSLENVTETNRVNIKTTDLLVNNHKFNNRLYELAAFKRLDNLDGAVVGGLNLSGSVLVLGWDTMLNKYMLIRRRIHTPLFFPKLDVPSMPQGLDIPDATKLDLSSLNALGSNITLEEYQKIVKQKKAAQEKQKEEENHGGV